MRHKVLCAVESPVAFRRQKAWRLLLFATRSQNRQHTCGHFVERSLVCSFLSFFFAILWEINNPIQTYIQHPQFLLQTGASAWNIDEKNNWEASSSFSLYGLCQMLAGFYSLSMASNHFSLLSQCLLAWHQQRFSNKICYTTKAANYVQRECNKCFVNPFLIPQFEKHPLVYF